MVNHVCPVWIGYLLASPIRKLFQNPQKLLSPYIEKDMVVLDVGCAMGFFSLPTAGMVGENGKVICVDIQREMIESLKKRALKTGVIGRIETRVCNENSLGLDDTVNRIDFAYAIAVVHEVRNVSAFFSQMYRTIKPGRKFLVVEPKGHVSVDDFKKTLSIARENGFMISDRPEARSTRVVVLKK